MNHEAELAKLTPFVAKVMRLLLEMSPKEAASRLELPAARIYDARRIAARRLGDASLLVAAIPPWRRGRPTGSPVGSLAEPSFVALFTTPGPDGHVHVARFNDNGNGRTDVVAGHQHRVMGLDVMREQGHVHELTERRAGG